MSDTPCRLYLVTPPRLEPGPFAEVLARTLDGGDVACLQLRLKGVDADTVRRAAEALGPVARQRDVAFLLNDDPALAAELGCDGVHIGQEDATYEEARRLLGPDAMIGVTCHDSRHLAVVAAEQGADYVAFGAFFPTGTKQPKTRAEPALLEWWRDIMVVPSVAIGGITVENCATLVQAGADFLAVVSGVWDHAEGPARAVADFNRAIAQATDEADET